MANNLVFRSTRKTIINHIQRRCMPVNVPPTATGKRRFRLEVETDPHKLVNYCCGLNYKKDEPPVKLKSDEEYPDWLWNLRLGPKPPSYEMQKGTKEYYLRLAEEGKDRNYRLKMKAAKVKKVVDKNILAYDDYIHHKRFAALAFLEDDVGLPQNSTEKDWFNNVNNIDKSEYYLPMNEKNVLYKDKVVANSKLKNYFRDEESSFIKSSRSVERRPSINRKAYQDSRQRHRHSVN